MASHEREEVALEELRAQQIQQLEAMVEKRRSNFDYIRKLHGGDSFWLNSVLLRSEDLEKYVQDLPEQRPLQFFYLALSLGKILDMAPGAPTVRALCQLLEEFEYHFSNSALQLVKYTSSRQSDCVYPQYSAAELDPEDTRSGLYRFQNEVVYLHLHTPHVPFPLDYIEVVHSLCDVLGLIYNKFLEEDCWQSQAVFESLVRVDGRIKHHVINLVAKEFTDLSTTILRAEFEGLLR